MTTRSDSIPLDLSEPRCEPIHCVARHQCARALASVTGGAPLGDFSGGAGSVQCLHYVDVRALRRQQAAAPAPRVHPAPRGIA
jgi:hypothetical protein